MQIFFVKNLSIYAYRRFAILFNLQTVNIRDQKSLYAFGKHLKSLRIKRGLSQEDVAHDADISESQVHRIETGKINPTLCTLLAIAKTLKVSIAELVTFPETE